MAEAIRFEKSQDRGAVTLSFSVAGTSAVTHLMGTQRVRGHTGVCHSIVDLWVLGGGGRARVPARHPPRISQLGAGC